MDPNAQSVPPPYSQQQGYVSAPPMDYQQAQPPQYTPGPPQVASYPVATSAYPQQVYQTQPGYVVGQQPQPMVQTTYIQQPVVTAGQPMITNMAPPQNNAVLAWMSCLFCFWPTGIVAIMNAHQVDEKMRVGDYHGAMMASRKARQFSLISIGVGVASWILGVVLVIIYIAIFASAVSRSSY